MVSGFWGVVWLESGDGNWVGVVMGYAVIMVLELASMGAQKSGLYDR